MLLIAPMKVGKTNDSKKYSVWYGPVLLEILDVAVRIAGAHIPDKRFNIMPKTDKLLIVVNFFFIVQLTPRMSCVKLWIEMMNFA